MALSTEAGDPSALACGAASGEAAAPVEAGDAWLGPLEAADVCTARLSVAGIAGAGVDGAAGATRLLSGEPADAAWITRAGDPPASAGAAGSVAASGVDCTVASVEASVDGRPGDAGPTRGCIEAAAGPELRDEPWVVPGSDPTGTPAPVLPGWPTLEPEAAELPPWGAASGAAAGTTELADAFDETETAEFAAAADETAPAAPTAPTVLSPVAAGCPSLPEATAPSEF